MEAVHKDSTHDDVNKTQCRSTSLIEIDLGLTGHTDGSLKDSFDTSEYSFDNVIGYLEDMLIDDDFHALQNSFLEKYWLEFEDGEENKHCYMPIFEEYTNQIEDFITSYLQKRLKNFDMDRFVSELQERKDNLEGEVFEVLLTLSDFQAFKEVLLDYRAMKEGRAIDLQESLCISSVPLK